MNRVEIRFAGLPPWAQGLDPNIDVAEKEKLVKQYDQLRGALHEKAFSLRLVVALGYLTGQESDVNTIHAGLMSPFMLAGDADQEIAKLLGGKDDAEQVYRSFLGPEEKWRKPNDKEIEVLKRHKPESSFTSAGSFWRAYDRAFVAFARTHARTICEQANKHDRGPPKKGGRGMGKSLFQCLLSIP